MCQIQTIAPVFLPVQIFWTLTQSQAPYKAQWPVISTSFGKMVWARAAEMQDGKHKTITVQTTLLPLTLQILCAQKKSVTNSALDFAQSNVYCARP
jgi:hypothetical protein